MRKQRCKISPEGGEMCFEEGGRSWEEPGDTRGLWKPEKVRKLISTLRPPEKHSSADTLIFNFWLPELRRNTSVLF